MKQVSNVKNSLVLSSPLQHPIYQRRSFSNCISIFLFLCIALFATSCQKESLQSISQSPDQLTSSQKQNSKKNCVPFKASFETLDEGVITGTGTGTHIGKSTFVATVDFDNFPVLTGTQILTAANGDYIYSTFSGSVVGPDENGILLITNNNIITGGTGRFAGATGSFTAHGISNINGPTGTVTFDGTICY